MCPYAACRVCLANPGGSWPWEMASKYFFMYFQPTEPQSWENIGFKTQFTVKSVMCKLCGKSFSGEDVLPWKCDISGVKILPKKALLFV